MPERRREQVRNSHADRWAIRQHGDMSEMSIPTEAELRERLTKLQFEVTQILGVEAMNFSAPSGPRSRKTVWRCEQTKVTVPQAGCRSSSTALVQ